MESKWGHNCQRDSQIFKCAERRVYYPPLREPCIRILVLKVIASPSYLLVWNVKPAPDKSLTCVSEYHLMNASSAMCMKKLGRCDWRNFSFKAKEWDFEDNISIQHRAVSDFFYRCVFISAHQIHTSVPCSNHSWPALKLKKKRLG